MECSAVDLSLVRHHDRFRGIVSWPFVSLVAVAGIVGHRLETIGQLPQSHSLVPSVTACPDAPAPCGLLMMVTAGTVQATTHDFGLEAGVLALPLADYDQSPARMMDALLSLA